MDSANFKSSGLIDLSIHPNWTRSSSPQRSMADTIIIVGKPHEYSEPTGHMADPSTMMHGAQALEHGAGIDRRATITAFMAPAEVPLIASM